MHDLSLLYLCLCRAFAPVYSISFGRYGNVLLRVVIVSLVLSLVESRFFVCLFLSLWTVPSSRLREWRV
jgi:hypothetical protein